MFYSGLFKFIKKTVAVITAFCGGASAIFLISGTGEALIRLLAFIIFFISAINLGVYAKETIAESRRKPAGGGQGRPGGGGPGGGQGGGGSGARSGGGR